MCPYACLATHPVLFSFPSACVWSIDHTDPRHPFLQLFLVFLACFQSKCFLCTIGRVGREGSVRHNPDANDDAGARSQGGVSSVGQELALPMHEERGIFKPIWCAC